MKYWEAIQRFVEDGISIRRKAWHPARFYKRCQVPTYITSPDVPKTMYCTIECNPVINYVNDNFRVGVGDWWEDDWEVLTKEEEDGLCRRSDCCLSAWKESTETTLAAHRAHPGP